MEEKEIRVLAEELLESDDNLFLVEVRVKGNVGNQKVLVFVDGDSGISIDQCAKLNRQLGAKLEELDRMPGKYTLEVSSPGLDFPITLDRQYQKNIGRKLEIEMNDGESIVGELKSIDEGSILIESKEGERPVSVREIKQSKIIVSFK